MSLWKLPDDITIPQRRQDLPVGILISNHNNTCFGCTYPQGLNMIVHYSEELWVSGTFLATPDMQGGPGVLHGGLMAAAFDEVMGCATRLATTHAVTGHLQTDYRQPAFIHQKITIFAKILGTIRRKIFVEAHMHGENPDILLAQAHAIFISIDPYQHYEEAIQRLGSQ